MKYIFDFDDVLFDNTKKLKKRIYSCLEEAGVPRPIAEKYYLEVREKEFSLKNFIEELLAKSSLNTEDTEKIYEEIMKESMNFANTQLIEKIKQLGKENCFLVTNGGQEFQKDKIGRLGIASLFSEVYIVPKAKKEIIYNICGRYKDEKVFFVDDNIKFFEDIDLAKCPNLENILYSI